MAHIVRNRAHYNTCQRRHLVDCVQQDLQQSFDHLEACPTNMIELKKYIIYTYKITLAIMQSL